jgi:hypothetical protein
MADPHVISRAITQLLLHQNGCQGVRAARGEFFIHQALVLDLVADGGGPVAARARSEARRYRSEGHAILGGLG